MLREILYNFPGRWWFAHRFIPRHRYNILRTDLKPDYYDPDTQITYAIFKAFSEWYENDQRYLARNEKEIEEMCHDEIGKTNYEMNKTAYQTLKDVYLWWTQTVKKDIEQYEYEKIKDFGDYEDYIEVMKIEAKVYDEVTEKLITIIKHRDRLWYL